MPCNRSIVPVSEPIQSSSQSMSHQLYMLYMYNMLSVLIWRKIIFLPDLVEEFQLQKQIKNRFGLKFYDAQHHRVYLYEQLDAESELSSIIVTSSIIAVDNGVVSIFLSSLTTSHPYPTVSILTVKVLLVFIQVQLASF